MANSGNNRRRQIEVDDLTHHVTLSVDSIEEVDTVHWLDECIEAGIIKDYQYQPPSYTLSESEKFIDATGKTRNLLREHVYTADFKITLDPKKCIELSKELKVRFDQLSCESVDVLVDVKGTFAKNDGGRSFAINQKWMYQKFKLFIYKLVPKNFFQKFGCPERSMLTQKTKKPRKMFLGLKTIKEIFKL